MNGNILGEYTKKDITYPSGSVCMPGGERKDEKILRRTFLAGMSGFVVTGCVGENTEGDDGWEGQDEPPRNEDLEPVPAVYETTVDVSGRERDPEGLMSLVEVNYQSEPLDDQRCEVCRYWIPDMNADGLGACSVVANEIEPDGWCSNYAPRK